MNNLPQLVAKLAAPLLRPGQAGPVKILVVEDETHQREMWWRLIRQEGVEVSVASTQSEALEELGRVDVLILDWFLGNVTAQVILDQFLSHRPGSPCAVVSGQMTNQLQSELYLSGVHNVFRKPAELNALKRTIDRYIEFVRLKRDGSLLRKRLVAAVGVVVLLAATDVVKLVGGVL